MVVTSTMKSRAVQLLVFRNQDERTWSAVKDRQNDDPEVSNEISEQALAMICLSFDPKIYGLVWNAKSAKKKKFGTICAIPKYEHSGSTRKIGLLRKLTGNIL